MDRPSLLRRFNPAMHRLVSQHGADRVIMRCVVQNRSDESRK
jgi:hypothetical protein